MTNYGISTGPSLPPHEARLNLQWVNHLLDSDPHNPDLWFKKAVYFQDAMVNTIPKRTLLKRVLLWYQQCLREDSTNWVYNYNYAVVLRKLNRHEEALKFVQIAVSLKPDDSYAQELLVLTMIRLGFYSQAIDAFKDAAKHGCVLNPEILGKTGTGQRVGGDSMTKSSIPDIQSVRGIYKNPWSAKEKLLKGELAFVFEAADPELFTLQCEVDELINLGLFKAAEEVCIHFELAHGANNLTQSYFTRLKALDAPNSATVRTEITAAYPLLDIATQHLPFEYLGIVNQIFKEGGVGKFITPQDVNDFDEQTRWHLERLVEPGFSFNDISSAFKPLHPDLLRVWNMASLNFVTARRMNHPLLITYTATTLAEFYDRLGESNLPFILYKIAAATAEKAGQWDYFVNAHGKCALILKEIHQLGPAVNYLEKTLKYEKAIAPLNQFLLYHTLAECYSNLANYEKAKVYYDKAQEIVQAVPEKRLGKSHYLLGLEAIEKGEVANLGYLPVLCRGLEVQFYETHTPQGPQIWSFTSKHELYDSLLQAFDNIYQTRQSLLEREMGFAYFQGYSELMNALVRTALELDLPGNALMHLEAQKSIILNNRLKYLLREKPADLPDSLWEDLQRLVTIHRRMVEKANDSETELEELSESTLADVADAIKAKLWECSQVSDIGAKQIQQKLAFGTFPQKIDCSDPEHTLILEFFPGACFLIHPDNPMNPEAIELPEATPQEGDRLTHELFGIIHDWLNHFSQSSSLAIAPPSDRFSTFLTRFNEVFYRPLAHKFDEAPLKNVCIIPHRILHVLPLNLLGLSDHPHGSLGERFAVSFSPSLTCLKSLSNPSSRKPKRCLIIANPVPQCPAGICRNPEHDCFSMGGAQQESRVLYSLLKGVGFDTVCLQGKDATLRTISTELGLADIVHFATHGFFDAKQPENSGVLLSLPENGVASGGLYFLHNHSTSDEPVASAVGEIFSLDYIWQNIDMFRCQSLNLSACSTAMVDWSERSDEFYGMANGFLYAGVQNILSNLWPAHDFVSEVFNLRYYEELLTNNRTPINALKATIERLKQFDLEGTRPFAHPFFWAGYRVIGFS